jgi:rhamnose utilization protein RhaD (predicted bifunctional aldolase and dehydrogenase)/NAD(P)-dependent dehydrogenase (short-subunit alcohol dehydrogenase family)
LKNRWSDKEAARFVARYGKENGTDLAIRTYSSQLLGCENSLVLHGGGNTSVKTVYTEITGENINAIFVKASGFDLASIPPEGHSGMDLDRLRKLYDLPELSDSQMENACRTSLFDARAVSPSIETLLHTFLPSKYIDHTHADAILALTNQSGGKKLVREALGDEVLILDYVHPGFRLAKAAAKALAVRPSVRGMVLMKHGLVTWGDDAKESYDRTIRLVTRAETFLAKKKTQPLKAETVTSTRTAESHYLKAAPVLRGCLAVPSEDPDRPHLRFILRPLISREVLTLTGSTRGKKIALTPALTADHLIRTKALPMWVDRPAYDDEARLRKQIESAIARYTQQYQAYFKKQSARGSSRVDPFDPMPRIILMPGLGAVCAGRDSTEAGIVRNIAARTLAVKSSIATMGSYRGLREDQIFDMEYFSLQLAKLDRSTEPPLHRSVAIITGAAGAIGAGISEALLENGCHVAVTDLPGHHLDSLAGELEKSYGGRVTAVPMDVTDPKSVKAGFDHVTRTWGGIDLVIVNAGAAHVSSLADMNLATFQKLERVNIEGTLHTVAESSRRFRTQGTGGDMVVISTKNVFAPGASFGAYSATKAAAHQLARIASLELAAIDVRVNLLSPDAVFSHGGRRSGLWQEVGPNRMRARDLDEAGLEEYYRNRNLLKAKVTAAHVANAVLFFATRQTPTTGATLPIDGGLPDSTPR